MIARLNHRNVVGPLILIQKMKPILIVTFSLIQTVLYGQIDTIIITDVYSSYFSFGCKNPMYVKYRLYKGGGDCDRKQFHFTTDSIQNTATPFDYNHSGYDQGHLCNAEDFAYDCRKDELTFRLYNCIPQTPNLNRGIWKSYEHKIRKLSQRDSLLILCGGIYNNKMIPNTTVYIPDKCWKLVYSLSSGRMLFCLLFTNKPSDNTVENITLTELEQLLGYKLNIL